MSCPTCGKKHAQKVYTRELSPRECDVLTQVVKGKTNKEVAEALFVSEKTVKFHMTNIFRKKGVINRHQLIFKYAVEKGIMNKMELKA